MSIEQIPNVEPFDFEQAGNMDEKTVIQLFLSQLEHPGISKSPHELAQAIQNFAGKGDVSDNPLKQVSRDRVFEANKVTALPSDSRWDELTDPDNEDEYDPLFTEITFRLKQVRDLEEYQDVRQALFILQDTLLTSYRLGVDVTYKIEQMVAFLCANLEDV